MPEFRFLSSPVPDRYGFQPLLSRGDLKALGMTNWKYTTLYPRGVIVVMVVVVAVVPEVMTAQTFRPKPSPEKLPPMFAHVFFITATKLHQIFIHPKLFRHFYAIHPHFNTTRQKTQQHKDKIVAFFISHRFFPKREKGTIRQAPAPLPTKPSPPPAVLPNGKIRLPATKPLSGPPHEHCHRDGRAADGRTTSPGSVLRRG